MQKVENFSFYLVPDSKLIYFQPILPSGTCFGFGVPPTSFHEGIGIWYSNLLVRICRCQGKMSVNMLSDNVSNILFLVESPSVIPGMIIGRFSGQASRGDFNWDTFSLNRPEC